MFLLRVFMRPLHISSSLLRYLSMVSDWTCKVCAGFWTCMRYKCVWLLPDAARFLLSKMDKLLAAQIALITCMPVLGCMHVHCTGKQEKQGVAGE